MIALEGFFDTDSDSDTDTDYPTRTPIRPLAAFSRSLRYPAAFPLPFLCVPCASVVKLHSNPFYFDYHATAPEHPVAAAAVARVAAEAWGNPASLHRWGAAAARELAAARVSVAEVLGVAPERIVWVSGATEAAHAAASSAAGWAPGAVALVGAGEHAAVLGAVATAFGERVELLPLDPAGRVAAKDLADPLAAGGVGLVALSAAHSESGVHQPWREAVAAAAAAGVPSLVDATAWLGRESPGGLAAADFVFFGGHKLGAPRGVGVLVTPADRSVEWLSGGGQEGGRRGGTENVAGAAALAAVLVDLEAQRPAWAAAQAVARDAFEHDLATAWPDLQVVGGGVTRLPNTSYLALPWAGQERWVLRLDRRGFAVGTGAACATGRPELSPLAHAVGLAPEQARRLVRCTSGWGTPLTAWADLAAAVLEVGAELQG